MNFLEAIQRAGVVGAGGAGFPTHIKYKATVSDFIINAVECEPLLYTDKAMIKLYAKEIVSGIMSTGEHLQASRIVIAIKKTNTEEIERLEKAIQEANADNKIEIHGMENYYPAGDEQMIVYDVTKRTVPPGGIPLDVDCVVSNVSTMVGVYDALQGKPITEKMITVTGMVKTPKVLSVPIGASFHQCLEACGGVAIEDFKIINGGPMMGKVYDQKALNMLHVTKTTSGIIIIDEDNGVSIKRDTPIKSMLNRAKSSCIQCSMCSDLCPRNLLGHPLNPHKVMRWMGMTDIAAALKDGITLENGAKEILEQALICCECGICELYACPIGLAPREVNSWVKKEFTQQSIRYSKKESINKPSSVREHRKISAHRMMARLGLATLYEKKPLSNEIEIMTVKNVRMMLNQHIGVPAIPIVKNNEKVEKGELIAQCPDGKLGASIHASIKGIVSVGDNWIDIKGGEA